MRIDDFGTIYNAQDEIIGYYENATQTCYNLDEQPINCPNESSIPPTITEPPTIRAKRTYWGILIILLILLAAAFFLWKMGKSMTN